MADVTSGNGLSSWTGTPPSGTAGNGSQRRSSEMAAFGLTPDELERRRQQTGVSAGGTGYVSGQQAPTGRATGALNAVAQQTSGGQAPSGRFATPTEIAGSMAETSNRFRTGTGVGQSGPIGPHPNLTPPGTSFPGAGAPRTPGSGGDTTTVSSALTAPGTALPAQAPGRGPMPAVANDTTTRTGAIGTGTGTTTGQPIAPSTGNPWVDQFLTPAVGDTGPAVASQGAAFGLSDSLEAERYNYRPGAAASQDRAQLEAAQQEEIRQRQLAALGGLNAAANGLVPSAAELQMRREAGKNVAATLGQARALGGRSAGGAARAGTLATADILANNAASGAQLRAAEQAQARNAEIQALGGVRGQDVDVASQNARLQQEQYANNLRAQLEQNELAERHRQALLQQQLAALGIGAGSANAIVGAGQKNAETENKFRAGALSGIGEAIGAML